jgi:hypothetical protein
MKTVISDIGMFVSAFILITALLIAAIIDGLHSQKKSV